MVWWRVVFGVLLLLLLATLISGFVWTFDGPLYFNGFSLITIHIFLAIGLLLLATWHFQRFRWIMRVPQTRNRQAFIRLAWLSLAGTLLWKVAGRTREVLALPGAERRFTGSYEIGSFSGEFPQVSWVADQPPKFDITEYRLKIDGAIESPFTLTYDQILELADTELNAILDCTGGWYSDQSWFGVSLATLLNQAQVTNLARSVTLVSMTGFHRRFSLDEVQAFLLATHVAGNSLALGHGFPLRLVAPTHRGVNWVKWINHIHVNESSKFWQSPLPLR